MKKYILVISLVLLSLRNYAQTSLPVADAKAAIKEGEKAGSNAKEDVLVNYLQIAAKNFTSTSTTAQLKLNWFALNTMDSVHKYNTTNFIKSAWQRNGQFLLAGAIDKSSNIKSIQGGVSYNVLNRRDTALHYYTSVYEKYFAEESTILTSTLTKFRSGMPDVFSVKLNQIALTVYNSSMQKDHKPIDTLAKTIRNQIKGLAPNPSIDTFINRIQTGINARIHDNSPQNALDTYLAAQIPQLSSFIQSTTLNYAINKYIKALGKQALDLGPLTSPGLADNISKYIDDEVTKNTTLKELKPQNLADLNNKILDNYKALVHYVAQQPLLNANYNYTYGRGSTLSSHIMALQYVQGVTGLASDHIGEFTASVSDTLSSNDPTGAIRNFGRNILTMQAGFNKILATQKKVSVMEVSASVENDQALSGYISKTDQNAFFFNAAFRARIASSPWLKLSLKYDPKAANVFGFLDFTYSIDK